MRRRILGVAVVAAAVATALFALPLAAAARQLFLTQAQGQLERSALRAVIRVDPALSAHDPVELPAASAGVAMALYDANGRRLTGTGPATADLSVLRALRGQATQAQVRGDLVATVPVPSGERVVAALRVQAPMTDVWHRTLTAWAVMLVLGCAAVAIAILVARRQARHLSRPLEALATAAATLGEGDFSIRTTRSGVPEIDQTGGALDLTAARIGRLVAREREFAANASHQLRTPLTGLRLGLETALDGSGSDLRSAARDAIATVDELEQTIDVVLTLRHEENIPAGGSVATAGVDQLLEDAAGRWQQPLRREGRTLLIEVEPGVPGCSAAAAGALRQILDVLLDNAVRHGSGPVGVFARRTGDALAVDVRDAGHGLVASDQVFVRGFSGVGGPGVGLALARDLAQAHGGRLLLTRTEPSTTFTVLLPAPDDPSEADPRTGSHAARPEP